LTKLSNYFLKPEGYSLFGKDIMVLLYYTKKQRSNKPKLKDINVFVYRMPCPNNI
jgi:hypothetical protein